jgi:hypothetical protein
MACGGGRARGWGWEPGVMCAHAGVASLATRRAPAAGPAQPERGQPPTRCTCTRFRVHVAATGRTPGSQTHLGRSLRVIHRRCVKKSGRGTTKSVCLMVTSSMVPGVLCRLHTTPAAAFEARGPLSRPGLTPLEPGLGLAVRSREGGTAGPVPSRHQELCDAGGERGARRAQWRSRRSHATLGCRRGGGGGVQGITIQQRCCSKMMFIQ